MGYEKLKAGRSVKKALPVDEWVPSPELSKAEVMEIENRKQMDEIGLGD